ncbi:MAG: type 1 glutamine amidotransferase [Alphaproteobacteria bacterium]
MTRILVLQHHPLEHPGTFRDFLAADGLPWDAVRLDAGEAIPSLDGYAAMIVMGGPQDVWQEERYPWLIAEKAAIREAVVERRLPYLGICLGHQLLAVALGGTVAPMPAKAEIGIREVELTAEGGRDPLLGGEGKRLACLQWHAAEVTALPEGAVSLARNDASEIQALRWGSNAYGLQFHVEASATTVEDWAGIPAYRQALERGLGEGELALFAAEAKRRAAALKASAGRLYRHFKDMLATSGGDRGR